MFYLIFKDELNKIERGEQRIKKYTTANANHQRKLADNNTLLSPLTPTNTVANNTNINNNNNTQLFNTNDTNFLSDWTTNDLTTSTTTTIAANTASNTIKNIIIKEEV